ncbi:unnamed protein product, partial [Mesorhabditis spiculigera]
MRGAVELFIVSELIALAYAQLPTQTPVVTCADRKDGRNLSCYTCMGRDLQNCASGLACCSGSCFKLIDKKHEVVLKGCTLANEEDASMKVRTLPVPLYWTKGEKVEGESYFCKSGDFCNEAPVSKWFLSTAALVLTKFLF